MSVAGAAAGAAALAAAPAPSPLSATPLSAFINGTLAFSFSGAGARRKNSWRR